MSLLVCVDSLKGDTQKQTFSWNHQMIRLLYNVSVFLFEPPQNIFCNRGGHQGVWDKHVRASAGTDDPRHGGCKQAGGGSHRGSCFRRRP